MKITIRCPKCKSNITIGVPKNSCVAVENCSKCGENIYTPKGECCIICAYSDKKCKELY